MRDAGSVLKIGQEAVGKPGAKETLPEKLLAKESPNDCRKLRESICEGPFRFPVAP